MTPVEIPVDVVQPGIMLVVLFSMFTFFSKRLERLEARIDDLYKALVDDPKVDDG